MSVTSCTILLKSNTVHINTMKSGYKNIDYHGATGIFIDCNGCAVLIFKEIWANDATAKQAKLLVMRVLASVRPCIGSPSPKCGSFAY